MELLGKLCMYGGFYAILIIAVLSYRGKKTQDQEFLGREATGELKGIAILMVLVGHLCYMFGYLIIPVTPALGAPAVDLFLFLSAFGLMSSFQKKGLKGFFKRRLAIVLIPYAIVTLMKIPFRLATAGSLSIKILLLNIFPVSVSPAESMDTSMWYVQYILIWYILFYVIFAIPRLSVKVKTALIAGIGVVLAVICGILYYSDSLFSIYITLTESYSHHLSFPMGAILFLMYDKLKNVSWKKYMITAVCAFIIIQFFAFPGVDGYVKYYINNLGYVVFFVALSAVLKHFGRCSGLLGWLGGLSYYIYLNELIVMSTFYNFVKLPDGIKAVLVILASVLLGIAEKYISEWILRKLKVR